MIMFVFFAYIKGRGLLQDATSMEDIKPGYCYVGFDPTADSLHIGNLLQLVVLQHMARLGWKPIALVFVVSFVFVVNLLARWVVPLGKLAILQDAARSAYSLRLTNSMDTS
jgi:hypothetical protein